MEAGEQFVEQITPDDVVALREMSTYVQTATVEAVTHRQRRDAERIGLEAAALALRLEEAVVSYECSYGRLRHFMAELTEDELERLRVARYIVSNGGFAALRSRSQAPPVLN